MKRFTILIAMIVFAYSLQGQNDAKYVYHFSGGLTIGGVYKGAKNVKIDSLINDAGVLKFYSGGAEVPVSGSVDTTNLSVRIDSMLNKTGTAWRVLYRNTSGVITELALGADGTYLKSNGATSAPTFSSIAGGGDVTKVGTPVNNQVGVWTGDGTLEGASSLTYDGSNLQLTGDIGATGTRITKGWYTDLQVTNAIAGAVTGNAGTVTGFTPASGSLTLSGADAVTITTTAETNVTLPTTGTLATTAQLDEKLNISDTIPANTLITMNADTGSVAWAIGGGNGLSGSQPSFLPGARLGGFTNPFPNDTLYIVNGRFHVVQDSGTVTMGFKFFKHATQIPTSASTDMMSAEITLSAATSATTTGTVITLSSTPNFSNYTLLPGESIAAIVTTKSNGNMPVWMDGTIAFRKQNRKF